MVPVAHRGRGGTDTMALKIGPPTAVVEQQQIADGNQAWGEHFGAYPVPAGQIITRFQFEAVATQSGSLSIGNFLDAIDFTPCPDTDGDGTADFEDTDADNDTIRDARRKAPATPTVTAYRTGAIRSNGQPTSP